MMRRILLLLCVISVAIVSSAETFDASNSRLRTAIVLYTIDAQGFYQKQSNVSVESVDNIEYKYAYDKKNKDLYVTTPNGNYKISLDDELAKQIKKDKTIPQLKEKEIDNIISMHNASLAEKFANLNLAREKHITDSINEVREKERIAREKARKDSIEAARKQAEIDEYKSAHNWHFLPITPDNNTYKYSNSIDLKCDLCDETVHSYDQDSIVLCAIHNDTIYSLSTKRSFLDYYYYHVHRFRIPEKLRASSKYQQHINVYGDSIFNDTIYTHDAVEYFNQQSLAECLDRVKAEAPYGFFTEWAWDDEYSVITFSFSYLNLNKRTIKYIDVYWKVTNDVGDVRKTGHFKGTGPLEQYESASWNWDYSSYYVAGDASTMEFTKVIITYMNGQQQVLTKNMIKID